MCNEVGRFRKRVIFTAYTVDHENAVYDDGEILFRRREVDDDGVVGEWSDWRAGGWTDDTAYACKLFLAEGNTQVDPLEVEPVTREVRLPAGYAL